MTLRLVLFDYDLTFVDNYIDFYEAYTQTLKLYGLPPLGFNDFVAMLENDTLEDSIPKSIPKTDFWRTFRKLYVSRHGVLKRGCRELLLFLKTFFNAKVVIISGRESSPHYIWMELRRLGVDEYVDEVYTMHDLEVLNGVEESLFDKTWLIKYVIRKYGVEPCETVFLGDYITDYYSATKSGVFFIGVNQSESRRKLMMRKGVRLQAKDLLEAFSYITSLPFLKC
ncbi:MAG: HAD hydrolase-like protein [Thermosphaera sp.]